MIEIIIRRASSVGASALIDSRQAATSEWPTRSIYTSLNDCDWAIWFGRYDGDWGNTIESNSKKKMIPENTYNLFSQNKKRAFKLKILEDDIRKERRKRHPKLA